VYFVEIFTVDVAVGMAINDAFIALTLLVGRQEEHLVVGCWCGYLSGAIVCILFAYGPADATATPNPIVSCLI